jgi:hypothetical protein
VTPRNLPLGGKELWQLRVSGQRPESMVVVSLVGPPRVANPVLWVGDTLSDESLLRLEWRMVADLDVEIVADGAVPLPRLVALIRALRPHAAGLFVRYEDIDLRVIVQWTAGAASLCAVDPDSKPGPLGPTIASRLRQELRR